MAPSLVRPPAALAPLCRALWQPVLIHPTERTQSRFVSPGGAYCFSGFSAEIAALSTVKCRTSQAAQDDLYALKLQVRARLVGCDAQSFARAVPD